MKKASITEAKNGLSALIERVKAGESALIMDRGRPVARLEPTGAGADTDDVRRPRLIRDGIIRAARAPCTAIKERDRAMLVWWGTRVECVSAVTRLERQGALVAFAIDRAFERLRGLVAAWDEVEGTEVLREVAQRFLRVHPLRAADAVQLAAAYVGSDRSPTSLEFVTLDERLADAARKERFSVVEIAVE
jgi:hypothetical protein